MSLTFVLDLAVVKGNQHARYLSQRFVQKLIVRTRTRTHQLVSACSTSVATKQTNPV